MLLLRKNDSDNPPAQNRAVVEHWYHEGMLRACATRIQGIDQYDKVQKINEAAGTVKLSRF